MAWVRGKLSYVIAIIIIGVIVTNYDGASNRINEVEAVEILNQIENKSDDLKLTNRVFKKSKYGDVVLSTYYSSKINEEQIIHLFLADWTVVSQYQSEIGEKIIKVQNKEWNIKLTILSEQELIIQLKKN